MSGISHERRARTVSNALCALPGLVKASASTSGSVRGEYDRRETTEEEVRAALRKLKVRVGKRVAADDHAGHDHGPGGHDAGEEQHGPGAVARQGVAWRKSVQVSVDLGGRRSLK